MHVCVYIHFKTANKKHRCAYLSTVSEGRTGLCCPLQWAGPPPRYRRPRTGRCQRHSCSAPKRRCRCSCCCCCCPPSLWWSCGRRHRCASKPEESCWPSCRAGRPTDSRHLGERERERGSDVGVVDISSKRLPDVCGCLLCHVETPFQRQSHGFLCFLCWIFEIWILLVFRFFFFAGGWRLYGKPDLTYVFDCFHIVKKSIMDKNYISVVIINVRERIHTADDKT